MIFWNQINVEPASSQKVDCKYFILLITKIWFIRCYVSLAKVDKCWLVNILVFWFSKWRNTRFTWLKKKLRWLGLLLKKRSVFKSWDMRPEISIGHGWYWDIDKPYFDYWSDQLLFCNNEEKLARFSLRFLCT